MRRIEELTARNAELTEQLRRCREHREELRENLEGVDILHQENEEYLAEYQATIEELRAENDDLIEQLNNGNQDGEVNEHAPADGNAPLDDETFAPEDEGTLVNQDDHQEPDVVSNEDENAPAGRRPRTAWVTGIRRLTRAEIDEWMGDNGVSPIGSRTADPTWLPGHEARARRGAGRARGGGRGRGTATARASTRGGASGRRGRGRPRGTGRSRGSGARPPGGAAASPEPGEPRRSERIAKKRRRGA